METATKRDYNSIDNQHIKGLLVQREVYYCQTSVVEELLKMDENLYILSELENYWHYRLDLSDGEFTGNNEDLQEKIEELEEKIGKLIDRLIELRDNLGFKSDVLPIMEDKLTALEDDLRKMDNPDAEPAEIYEWWLISDHLARDLKAKGQVIWEEYGYTWWGRQTTGQAILLDHVISMIAEDMEILDDMKNSWGPVK